MRLIIVRHAEPNYEIDGLTDKGKIEAELVSQKLSQMKLDHIYVSPLGRARLTAKYTLDKLHREEVIKEFLREFKAPILKPNLDTKDITWDWLPQDWTIDNRYFDRNTWYKTEVMQEGHVEEEYTRVCNKLDELLKEHGYERQDNYYHAVHSNENTIVFFCHFGVESVILSHLLNISPMLLWHGTCALPSSITEVVTEERRDGIAYFRMLTFGDVSHLTIHGEEPSFHARFRECYYMEHQRKD